MRVFLRFLFADCGMRMKDGIDDFVRGGQRQKPILVKRATQSAPTPRELPNGWEKTTEKYSYHADTFTRSSGHAHLKTFSRTPYGHEHGWDTVATRCGRPTSPHAPKEHGTRPTTTWDDCPAMETMHRTAQPRQHASDCTQQAQTHAVRRAPTSTSKRRPHRHVQACCKGFRAAAARRARRASDPSRSDPKTRTSRELQADLPTAELQARRPARRGW